MDYKKLLAISPSNSTPAFKYNNSRLLPQILLHRHGLFGSSSATLTPIPIREALPQIEAKVGSVVHGPEQHRTQRRPMGRWIRGHGEGRRWPGAPSGTTTPPVNGHSAPLARRLPQHDPLNHLHSARGEAGY